MGLGPSGRATLLASSANLFHLAPTGSLMVTAFLFFVGIGGVLGVLGAYGAGGNGGGLFFFEKLGDLD